MSIDFSAEVRDLLNEPATNITVLTGAGISAESGIPTFRGPEGYWTLGSRSYMPEEVATWSMFSRYPEDVWAWYLYRLGVCLRAKPNHGHAALATMEYLLGDRFTLITQNIDNLHIRAGNSPARTFQIHGNINYTRCSRGCRPGLIPLAEELKKPRTEKELDEKSLELLKCPDCSSWLRPHVLWFDEYYDEENFRFDSSMRAAATTRLLVVVGTSGATTLPNHVVSMVYQNQGTIIDINPEETPFSAMAAASPGGGHFCCAASTALSELVAHCPSA